ncbi:hypothetical protein [Burkholderia glumae]|uniref:hypothetical protein n=1 Tax=Burkholderia glumae TaxID=337 RepID=UPI00214FDB91|nr:hypothetical protein [Burkholderia glumae]
MTQRTKRFLPHSVSCCVDTPTTAPISICAEHYKLPLGTVVRIVVTGVLANDALRNLVTSSVANAPALSKDGRALIGAMMDDSTQEVLLAIGRQADAPRSKVVRAALVVGAKHLEAFTHDLETERDERQASHERGREQMIQMVKRFQAEVVA